jgi:hypothetical protein
MLITGRLLVLHFSQQQAFIGAQQHKAHEQSEENPGYIETRVDAHS